MLRTAVVQAADNQFEDACQRFSDQARLLLPLNNLTIVLLPSVKDSGKVVYSWKSKAQPGAASIVIPPDSKLSSRLPSPPLSLPIYGSCGILGAVLLSTTLPQRFSRQENRLASDIVKQLAVNLENIQLRQRVQTNSWEMELADQIEQIISTAVDLETLFTNLVSCLNQEIEIEQGLLSWIAFNGYDIDTIICSPGAGSAAIEQSIAQSSTSALSQSYESRLTVPLTYQEKIVGSLEMSRRDRPFTGAEQDLMHAVGNQIAAAIHYIGLRRLTMQQAHQLNQTSSQVSEMTDQDDWDSQVDPRATNDLAHALYSPLTSIKGYTETLLQPDEDWPKEVRQEFLQTIHQAANRLDHAIRDLVIPPRRESGPTESQTRVQDLFRQFELERSSQAEVDSVHFQCDPNLPAISIDPFIFQRAIDHLIDCCISFGTGPTSAGPDHLHILAESAQDSVVISLGFSTVDAPDSTTESPIASAVETNLKTVISRNLLEGQGISLEVERPDRHSVLFRFSVPFKQTANQLP